MYRYVNEIIYLHDFLFSWCMSIIFLIVLLISLFGTINIIILLIKPLKDEVEKMLKLFGELLNRPGIKIPSISKVIRIFLPFFCIFLFIFIGRSLTDDLPPNARLTKASWDAFNAKDYNKAIEIADDCIDQFGPAAERMQRESRWEPPEGRVSESERERIHAQGPLNDVATCWFIKGWSLEKQKKIPEAIAAYREAERFPHARTWDLSGFFWKPAIAASDRRTKLER
jgi:tetratricopeptide (TPR) repeat protein